MFWLASPSIYWAWSSLHWSKTLKKWLPLQPWWQSMQPWWMDTPVYGWMKCWFYSSRTELTGKTKSWILKCNCSWQDMCGSQELVNENIFVSLSSFIASSGDQWAGEEGLKNSEIVSFFFLCYPYPMSASIPALIHWEEPFHLVSISSIGPVSCFHITSLLSMLGTAY